MLPTPLARSAALLVLLTLLTGIVGASPVAAHPGHNTIALSGPYGRVTITRDNVGVPLVRAHGEDRAQLGLGYAHAQDRLWQMEWQRHLASGRTAELLGPKGLPADTLFRTVGLWRAAEGAWAALSPDERQPSKPTLLASTPSSPPGWPCRPSSPSSASRLSPGRP
jgi:penicillin amidase